MKISITNNPEPINGKIEYIIEVEKEPGDLEDDDEYKEAVR